MTILCEYTGKQKLTRREALDQARWWQRTRLARMRHYRCRCGSWHVGNNRKKPTVRR